ncbi:MAG: N-acetylmuramoyl-L-alanine amidase [Flavobacteriales bacterium]|nr:N-acetylmuramoyl-L-alanine amidase [Flavobacteriales bacterium]
MRKLLILIALFGFFWIHAQDSTAKMIVVIDAGHGGNDPGNLHQTNGLMDEKDLNLAMALKLGGYIEQFLGHRVEVVYTRTEDVYVSLEDRVKKANEIKADYFISIHCNASDNKEIHGAETHIHLMESTTSSKLAHMIQDQFKNRAARVSRGVKLKNDRLYNLFVLKETKMPAVLVETGFMTNTQEEAYLNSEYGQDLLMSAVFRAFRDYVKEAHGVEMQTESQQVAVQNEPVWKIQVMASTGPVALDNPDFLSVNAPVEEIVIQNPNSAFNYKYYVGAYADKKEAKAKLKEVKEGVFKDAFLVKFE